MKRCTNLYVGTYVMRKDKRLPPVLSRCLTIFSDFPTANKSFVPFAHRRNPLRHIFVCVQVYQTTFESNGKTSFQKPARASLPSVLETSLIPGLPASRINFLTVFAQSTTLPDRPNQTSDQSNNQPTQPTKQAINQPVGQTHLSRQDHSQRCQHLAHQQEQLPNNLRTSAKPSRYSLQHRPQRSHQLRRDMHRLTTPRIP